MMTDGLDIKKFNWLGRLVIVYFVIAFVLDMYLVSSGEFEGDIPLVGDMNWLEFFDKFILLPGIVVAALNFIGLGPVLFERPLLKSQEKDPIEQQIHDAFNDKKEKL